MAIVPGQVRHSIDRAMRIARGERSVTCLVIANDVQQMSAEQPPRKHGTVHSGLGYVRSRVVPVTGELGRAADVLNAGRRVAILVGPGALRAEILQAAEVLGACVAKALLGKAAVSATLAAALEKLNGAFVLFRFLARVERTEVARFTGLAVQLPRIEAELPRLELADHADARMARAVLV
jgi:thiamine pyrophosphate-dependent acetolactate synthase large subunit-like protein